MIPLDFICTRVIDTDAFCTSQTKTGAGYLTLNGALVANGKGELTTAHKVSFTSTANLSAVNFTVRGRLFTGPIVSEVIAGPNNTTVKTSLYFTEIISVYCSAGFSPDTVIVGVNGFMSTPTIVADYHRVVNKNSFQIVQLVNNPQPTLDFTLSNVNLIPSTETRETLVWKQDNTYTASNLFRNWEMDAIAFRLVSDPGANGDSFRVLWVFGEF